VAQSLECDGSVVGMLWLSSWNVVAQLLNRGGSVGGMWCGRSVVGVALAPIRSRGILM
jgi:hypothetical protein